jgi:hypothetical protein
MIQTRRLPAIVVGKNRYRISQQALHELLHPQKEETP